MDWGGGLRHFSSPRIPASAPFRFLLSSARFSPRCVESSGNLRTSAPPEAFSGSFPCWRESFLNLHKALHKSQYAVKILSSCEPQVVDLDGKEIARKNKLLIDCEIDQQRVVGGIVALGKFDALHLGHRELIIQASKAGIPFLLSFVGVAEVLGRESRAPIVAKCDRSRVLSLWAPHCNDIVPLEYQIDFSNVRHLTPRQFVERLSDDLRAGGIVAGSNYRFGYKASGDANDLVRLCEEYGLFSRIVDSVDAGGAGEISSTRVRNALAARDMVRVTELLGRKHRLVLVPPAVGKYRLSKKVLIAPKSCLLNQPPGDGEFKDCTLLLDGVEVGRCFVIIDSISISIELDCGSLSPIGLIGIEFD